MIEVDVRGAGVADQLEQRDGGVGRPPRDKLSRPKAAERGVQVVQALADPPPGYAAGVVRALLLWRPDVRRHHLPTGTRRRRERRVVLHPEVPPEPHHDPHRRVPAAQGRGRDRHGAWWWAGGGPIQELVSKKPPVSLDRQERTSGSHGARNEWCAETHCFLPLLPRDSQEQWRSGRTSRRVVISPLLFSSLMFAVGASGFCWDSSRPVEKEAVDIRIAWLGLI